MSTVNFEELSNENLFEINGGGGFLKSITKKLPYLDLLNYLGDASDGLWDGWCAYK